MGGGLGPDFRKLWWAATTSTAGSAIGTGAIPLVAILVLHADAAQVSLLAAAPRLAGALLSLPVGAAVEFRAKRPVMMAADVLRFLALASVPLTIALNMVTLPQLYAVSVVSTVALVTFTAAAGAHLRALVAKDQRTAAASQLESANWLVNAGGPPLGGLLVSAAGPGLTMLCDAISYVASALFVRSIQWPEPPPPERGGAGRIGPDLVAGWRYLLGHRELALLFGNAVLFGAAVLAASPLEVVFMLDELGYRPWQYGLLVGLPCLGGVAGSWLAPRLSNRFGPRRTLFWAGLGRTPWLLPIPFVGPGPWGMLVFLTCDTCLLFAAGIFNPLFGAHRMDVTRPDMMARVVGAWSVGGRLAWPLFIAAGGAVAALAGTRIAIGAVAVLCLLSVPFLLFTPAEPGLRTAPGTSSLRRSRRVRG
ncbi:MFS transporter [Amycolatopsis benzoatilytica]|uniref:MFS transporter n=1 Tax=Amycolatopsis benzoatilytica TaxID=346045 RepID=UPI0003608AF3|nr:MFS transporter [Amycolatopsis benzoatilytica]